MNGIERIKLIGKLVQLNKTVPGASPVERIKGIGQIITIVKQLGGTVNAGGAKAGPLVIHSDDELIKLWRENKVDYIAAGNEYLSKNHSYFAVINPADGSMAFEYAHGSTWWKWIASDGEVVPNGYVAVSEVINAFCKAKANGGEVRKIEHIGGPYAEELGLESNFPAIKSNKDFVKFFDENDCEIRYGDEPEIKHLESYLKSSGQTHFECENWVNEDGFRDGGNGIISTTTKVKEKQVWDFNGKDWGYYLESDEAYRRLGEAQEAVAAFAEGVRNGTLKVINATPEKPASPEGKVTSVGDFCRRIEMNPTAIQDPENQTRKLLFAYLEEKHPNGFKGTLSLKGVDGEDHAYTAVWSRINGEWYRDVQAHPEMTGALSQLDQDGSLVLFDFLRFASNGSLNSLPKYTPEDGEVSEAVAEAWAKDRETLQSIIDGVHPDMKLPVLYDALAGINKRQKYNPEYPEMLERALDEWQSVVMDMTAKIVA